MPDLDARLRDAIREGARSPLDGDVMTSVAAKRAHRRVVRRVQVSAVAALSVLAVVAGSLVVLDRSDDSTTQVAAPPGPSTFPKVRVVDPSGRSVRAPVHLVGLDEDEGYVRGPLIVQGDTVTAAAYDRDGAGFTFPPSRIVRFGPGGHVLDRVDLQGLIESLTEGEGARWALTRDQEVLAPPDPEYRVKRIGSVGEPRSNAVPRGELPAGDLVATGGAVWLPVSDGVLRFDAATGEYQAKIPLTTTVETRAVATLGKTVFVTDGDALRTLDAGSAEASEAQYRVPEPGAQYVDIASIGGTAWALASTSGNTFTVWEFEPFGDESLTETVTGDGSPLALELIDHSLWISALTDRGAVLYDGRMTVRIGQPRTIEAATPVSADTIVFTRGGSIFRTRIR